MSINTRLQQFKIQNKSTSLLPIVYQLSISTNTSAIIPIAPDKLSTMTKINSAAQATNKKQYDPLKSKPYNRNNDNYRILERERFLKSQSGYNSKSAAAAAAEACSLDSVTSCEFLDPPDLPPRYASLDLPHDMPGECYYFWTSSFHLSVSNTSNF